MFKKCKETGVSEFLALLDYRNTPTEGVGTSPSQHLIGQRCKTLLLMTTALLQPRFSTEEESRAILAKKEWQRYYYDKSAHPLPPLHLGDTVRMLCPGQSTWMPGVCQGQIAPRSYDVRVGDAIYRRNRRDLLLTSEHAPLNLPQDLHLEPKDKVQSVPAVPSTASPAPPPTEPRCSTRQHRPPAYLRDYDTKW